MASPCLTKRFSHRPTQFKIQILYPDLVFSKALSFAAFLESYSIKQRMGPCCVLCPTTLWSRASSHLQEEISWALSGCNNLISPSQKMMRASRKTLFVHVPFSKAPKPLYEGIIFLSESWMALRTGTLTLWGFFRLTVLNTVSFHLHRLQIEHLFVLPVKHHYFNCLKILLPVVILQFSSSYTLNHIIHYSFYLHTNHFRSNLWIS